MRLLIVGGAGTVGRSLLPHLTVDHTVTVLDTHPLPQVSGADPARVRSVVGDATDPDTLMAALTGVDAIMHLATVVPRGHQVEDAASVRAAFDVNVTSVYLALRAALRSGVTYFVHASTLSVYRAYGHVAVDLRKPPDSTAPYGLSKRLGEQVCQAMAEEAGDRLVVTTLRLAYPTTAELWPDWRSPGDPTATPRRPHLQDGTEFPALAPDDLARAVNAALQRHGDYVAVAITGDAAGASVQHDPTPQLLAWRPRHGQPPWAVAGA